MATYIDAAYVAARLGQELADAIWPTVSDLEAAIDDASEYVQGTVRMHCRDGSAELGETTTDVIVKQGTYAALVEAAAARPTTAFELAPNWETTPYRKALDAIEKGKIQISVEADPVIADAVSWTTVVTLPQRTSRDEIGGL